MYAGASNSKATSAAVSNAESKTHGFPWVACTAKKATGTAAATFNSGQKSATWETTGNNIGVEFKGATGLAANALDTDATVIAVGLVAGNVSGLCFRHSAQP